MSQIFFDAIIQEQKGFVVINNKIAFFANDPKEIQQMSLGKKSRDELIFFIHDMKNLAVRSYPLDESNSAIVIIGTLHHTNNEKKLLKQLMYKSGIIPDENTIGAIIPRKRDWDSVIISDDLSDELDEIINSDDAKKLKITNKSQIITAATREFLLNFYNKKRYVIKSKMKGITLNYAIIGRYIFCNLCSSYDCEHIELFFNEETVRASLEKKGINPIRYKIPDDMDFPENFEYNVSKTNKEKVRRL